MNFEPLQVLKAALDFYISSGIVDPKHDALTFPTGDVLSCNADRQRYEQINLFLFGHFFPDFAPIVIDFAIMQNKLRTSYKLPKASNAAYHSMFENLSFDQRLKKMTDSYGAKIGTQLSPPVVIFDIPLIESHEDQKNAYIDLVELRRKYETRLSAQVMIESFMHNANRHLMLLQQAIELEDWNEAVRHVQIIKQGAFNICAIDFLKSTKKLENLLVERYNAKAVELLTQVLADFSNLTKFMTDQKEYVYGQF